MGFVAAASLGFVTGVASVAFVGSSVNCLAALTDMRRRVIVLESGVSVRRDAIEEGL
jgi:hypothetical protein